MRGTLTSGEPLFLWLAMSEISLSWGDREVSTRSMKGTSSSLCGRRGMTRDTVKFRGFLVVVDVVDVVDVVGGAVDGVGVGF